MGPDNFDRFKSIFGVLGLIAAAGIASAEPQHGIAMYGEPALGADFTHLPYVNPDAPKGGKIVFAETGSFDSLHPFITAGSAPYGWRVYGFETLMWRSWDEPFTLYGVLAESVETGPNREWVEYTLRPEAKFSDGSPVTVEDVLWSYETLGTLGHGRYQGSWAKVAKAEAVGERTVRFTFNTADNELALLMGMRPILKKASMEGRPFDESTMEPPIGSGPYVIGDFEAGRFVSLVKDPDWWGADLPFNRGQHNLDEIRYEFFGDGDVAFEAFRAGEVTSNRENNAAKLLTNYNFPAVQNGDVVLSKIPHQRPSGIRGFVMNTRKAQFDDWRVRDALIHAFNFEFINDKLNGGTEPRITSYFSNSVLGMEPGAAQGRVAELLAPFADDLPPGALEGYTLPASDGSESNRRNIRTALKMLEEAGWTIQDGALRDADGKDFELTILMRSGASQADNIAQIYIEALKRLGISAVIDTVEAAQYKERTEDYDFDMAYYSRGVSLSPGNEQLLYWGKDGVETPGTRNWMGMDVPAVEAMIETMLTAQSQDEFRAAVKALDRVLTSGRYVIPIWHSPVSTIAHRKELKYQEPVAMYGDWIGFSPDVWWYEE
ncbi:ABC transporter substrate-binding protein [Alphaproteobacteria bacterium KMM 3653]|uniref:ABC transporter substrate-binding protein n=1 Tax=Harenicola maris TaxID=2841044 RepID=A0AAP2G3K6_9RHOB|nr:ABC transporter substrate-binding protein [Harenicola maris]